MPRYHFNVHEGQAMMEAAAFEIENPNDVRREAIRRAAAHLFNESGVFRVPHGWRLEVVDELGEVLIRLVYA